MKKPLKIVLTVLMTVALLIPTSVSAFAALPPDDGKVELQWTSISSMNVEMAFNGDASNATGTARKQTTATSIEGTVTVYKLVGDTWEFVADAYKSTTRVTLAVSVDFEAESGYTYKAEFEVTAYTNGTGESHTATWTEVCA